MAKAKQNMAKKIRFPELGHVLDRHGLTVSDVHRMTTVSRNTIMAIRDGEEVTPASISKVLVGLRNNSKDVAGEFEIFKQRKVEQLTNKLFAGRAGLAIVSDQTETPDATAREAFDSLTHAERDVSRVLRLMQAGEPFSEFNSLRNIKRLLTKIKADVDEWEFMVNQVKSGI